MSEPNPNLMISLKFKCKDHIDKYPYSYLKSIKFFNLLFSCENDLTRVIHVKIPWGNSSKEERKNAVYEYFKWRSNYFCDYKYLNDKYKKYITTIIEENNNFRKRASELIFNLRAECFNMPENYTDLDLYEAYMVYNLGNEYYDCKFINKIHFNHYNWYGSNAKVKEKLNSYKKIYQIIKTGFDYDEQEIYKTEEGKKRLESRKIKNISPECLMLGDYFMDDQFLLEHKS